MKAKLIALLLTVVSAAASGVEPAKTIGPTAKSSAGKDASCCAAPAVAPGSFSSESLYQVNATYTDDMGRARSLGSLRGHPVVLDLFFASCGYACPLTVTDMLALQARLPDDLRRRTLFVLVSFDVVHDTPVVLAKYRTDRCLDGQWILLHGDDDAVRELAALVGVKFKQEADGSFAHSNLLTVLNPEGEIVHQRIGLRGGLFETSAAVMAAGGK